MKTLAKQCLPAFAQRRKAIGMVAAALFLHGCGGSDTGLDTGAGPNATLGTMVSSSAREVPAFPVSGWASQGEGTTGGAGAPPSNIYVVRNWAQLKAALANRNSPTFATNPNAAKLEPKIIQVVGTLYGTDIGNGRLADEAYYKSLNATAAKWDWNLYLQSLDTAFMADLNKKVAQGDPAAIALRSRISALSSAKSTLRNIQKEQIQAIIPSNTTIVGVGADAKLIDGYFSINASRNIILRNLELEAPLDLTADWNGKEWNARYKAISVVTGKQLWIDHNTLSDGSHFDSAEVVTINGVTSKVQRHDGLIDMEDSTDYVTISYNIFKNHDKTNMVGGSGDQNGAKEREFNRLTFSNNIWENTTQRAPRARFGRIHVYNNYYKGDTAAQDYKLSYYIGMGAESKILSEANAFEISGPNADASKVVSNLNGYQFKDVGSWINGVPSSIAIENAARAALEKNWASASAAAVSSNFTLGPYTNVLGWTPPYAYTPGASFDEVRQHNRANSGAGKVAIEGATLDVSAGFAVLRSGLAWNRSTNKYSGTITLTNKGGTAVNGPVQLVLAGLPGGVTLDNATGLRNGSPYVTVAAASIAPGASVTVPLTYSNPAKLAISNTNSIHIGIF
ncbi:polysaccharide lyase family 1 protein [uncultured Massilia sp.]|uniref:pectate lyase family protein n=1 Tax=uncultured Massilia sp. TaxID=169973 RepID=UPI002588B095|nr:polysaccharide lyase family 1 protein [uncultured Massilia sp.]